MRANKEFTRKREMNNAIANVSDDELITLIRKGHEAAFEALIARHRNAIVAHATRILRDQDEAETEGETACELAPLGRPLARSPPADL